MRKPTRDREISITIYKIDFGTGQQHTDVHCTGRKKRDDLQVDNVKRAIKFEERNRKRKDLLLWENMKEMTGEKSREIEK